MAYIQDPRLLKEKIRGLFEKYVQRADMVSSESPALALPHGPVLGFTSPLLG